MPHNPETRLITLPQIVELAFVDKNFNQSLLKDLMIEVCQEDYIRPILTEDLFNEIITQIQPAGTITSANQDVIDLVVPALAFFVKSRSLPEIMARITSLGIQLNNSEFSATVTDRQRADLQASILQNAQTLADKITKFLNDNSSIYPLYEQDGINIDNEFESIGGIII